ncbi:hypothetical protein [Micromonospora sp. DT231]
MRNQQPTENAWREKLTLAAITGLISGTVRAVITWVLPDRI